MKVAFIGHRKIEQTEDLKKRLQETILHLIIHENADTFLFGSRSEFNDLCYEIVTQLKDNYPQIRRVYVRAEYEYIDKTYNGYLFTLYEETFFPEKAHGAGVLSYVKRNQVMVDMCDVVIVFYDEHYRPRRAKSGTYLAVSYAQKKNKRLINAYQ